MEKLSKEEELAKLATSVSFSTALDTVKRGGMIARVDWPMDNYIFQQVPCRVPIEIVPTMQSLPQSVKDDFVARAQAQDEFEGDDTVDYMGISYHSQIAKVSDTNSITGWAATPEDMCAQWIVL
jgi:hypothetical protein